MIYIIAKSQSDPEVTRCVAALEERLEEEHELRVVHGWKEAVELHDLAKKESAQTVITIGGDGISLTGAGVAYRHRARLLSIHMGHVGFLAQWEWDRESGDLVGLTVEEALALKPTHRMVLKAGRFRAFNDLVVRARESQLVPFVLHIDDEEAMRFRSDGVILATPAGSTAYSMSAGGPILEPDIAAIQITPIAPQFPTVRPITVSARRVITLRIEKNRGEPLFVVDGHQSVPVTDEEVLRIRKSERNLHVLSNPIWPRYRAMRERLHWG